MQHQYCNIPWSLCTSVAVRQWSGIIVFLDHPSNKRRWVIHESGDVTASLALWTDQRCMSEYEPQRPVERKQVQETSASWKLKMGTVYIGKTEIFAVIKYKDQRYQLSQNSHLMASTTLLVCFSFHWKPC